MSYLTTSQATKVFRSKGQKVYGSYSSALKAAKKINGRTAILSIGGNKHIIKKV